MKKYEKMQELYERLCDEKNLEVMCFSHDEFIPVWKEMCGLDDNDLMEAEKDPDELRSVYELVIEAADYIPSYVGRCPDCGTLGLDEIACCDEREAKLN
jgi:aromatic ring hydroxylase